MNLHHWRTVRRDERRQRGRCAARERSFLSDGGSHGRPQGSSGCDGRSSISVFRRLITHSIASRPCGRTITVRLRRIIFLTNEHPILVQFRGVKLLEGRIPTTHVVFQISLKDLISWIRLCLIRVGAKLCRACGSLGTEFDTPGLVVVINWVN